MRPLSARFLFFYICRVLQESLYGYHIQNNRAEQTIEGDTTLEAPTITVNALPDGIPQHDPIIMDPDLAMALRISEQEQRLRQEEIQREQEMIEEALRLSLQEK